MKKIVFIIFIFLFAISTAYAKPESIKIKYNVNDSQGRCGNPKKNNCMAVAKVKYDNGEEKTYYMPKQYDAEGLIIDGSCRSHALVCALNTLTGSKYSTLDLQNYLKKYPPKDGRLMASNINNAFKFFKVDAHAYKSDISKSKMISLIYQAFQNNKPVILFVNHRCSDIAYTNHALLLLGVDKDNNAVFIDSSGYSKNAKKRTVSELVKNCYVSKSVADGYFSLVTFKEDENEELSGGSTYDIYGDNFINKPESSNDFTCQTILINQYGEPTEFKKILDGIFNLIQVAAPLIAIALTILDYYKVLTTTGDTKKANIRTIKRIVIATLIVFLPLLLDLLFHLFGLYDLSTCNIGK